MKKLHWFLFFILSVLLVKTGLAQTGQLHNYTVKDGLSGNVVYHIYSDSKGYLWIGTNLGVSRFDGREFVNYSVLEGLPDNDVFISKEDHLGRIWFGTYKADLSYFHNDSIYPFRFNEQIKEKIPDKTVKLGFYFRDSSDVFVADRSNSLIHIDKTGEVNIIGGYDCSIFDFGDELLTTQDKKYSFSTSKRQEQGYRLYDGANDFKVIDSSFAPLEENRAKGSHYSIKTAEGSYILIKGDYIWHIGPDSSYYTNSPYSFDCVFIDQGGEVWLGSHNHGIHIFSDATLTDTIGHILDGQTITHITKDFEGGIWISSIGHGIYHLPFVDYERLNGFGIPQGEITDLVKGPDNTLFVAYKNGETWAGSGQDWQLISKLEYEGNRESMVMYFDIAQNTFYVKAQEIYPSQKFSFNIKHLSYRDDVSPKSYLKSVKTYKGDLMEIRGRGIFMLGENTPYAYQEKLFEIGISDAIEHNDTLWIGSLQGLYYLVNDSLHFYRHPQIGDKHVLQILYWHDYRIVVTENHGILIENGVQSEWINNQHFLPHGITKCRIDENGILWIGSHRGLYYLNVENRSDVKKLSAQQGIWNEKVNDLVIVGNNLFIAGEDGLIRVKKSIINEASILPPRIYTSLITVNGRKWSGISGSEFEYDQNNIEVKMTSVSFTNQEDRIFDWKLDGLDTKWNRSHSDVLAFSRLSPGTYNLLVRSRNVAGIWSETSTLNFTIKPAFWQRTAFLFICIFLLGLLIFTAFYLRIKTLQSMAKRNMDLLKEKSELEIRALRAQMNPHFVFNSLTSIQYLINSKKNEEAEFYLNKFSRLLRLIVDQAGFTEITLLNELDLLRIFIDLENLRYEDKFEFDLDIDDAISIDTVMIPGIMLQPFIENAIEHGLSKKEEKGLLQLGIKRVNKYLEIIIEDDGIGRAKAAELRKISGKLGQSIGVYNVKRRMDLLKMGNQQDDYNFEIEDLFDEEGKASGTRITLKLPYKLNEA